MKLKYLVALIAILTLGCGGGKPSATPTASGSPAGHSEEAGHDHGAEEGHDHGSEQGHAEEGHEEGHEEGEEGFVTPTDAQRKEVGFKTEAVSEAAVSGVTRTGRIEANPDRSVVVSPQVSGTVRHLPVIIGSRIRKGDVIAVLNSPEVVALKGEYHNAQVEVDLASKELANKESLFRLGDESRREVEEAKLQVAEAEAKRDAVQARLHSAKMTHERLAKLQSEGIASVQQVEQALAERKALEADLREAITAISVAKQHLQRESRISGSELRRKAETFPASAGLARARENVKHIQERLVQLGADLGEDGSVTLTSPIDGQVIKRPINRGQMIDVGATVAELMDPSEIWVMVDLTRDDISSIEVGDEVTVALVSNTKKETKGQVSFIDPQVDAESQTVRARVELRETGGDFRVGSFINATFQNDDQLPSLPKNAIQEVEGQTVVYRADGKGFRRTPVEIVSRGAERVSVKGLPQGSQVVTKGATDLKSMDLAGSIGGHSH